MNLLKLGLISKEQCLEYLRTVALRRSAFTPEEVRVVRDLLDHAAPNANMKEWKDSEEVWRLLLPKCYWILSVKTELHTLNCDGYFKKFEICLDAPCDPGLIQQCVISIYKYTDVWNIIEKLTNYLFNFTTDLSHDLFNTYFSYSTILLERQSSKQFEALKNAGLIFSSCCAEYERVGLNAWSEQELPRIISQCLLALHKCEDQPVLNCYLNSFLEPYLCKCGGTQRAVVLQELWNIVTSSFVSSTDDILRQTAQFPFAILSFMLYFIFETKEDVINLFVEDIFWRIVLFGLIQQDALSRKRSQTILKISILIIPSDSALLSKYIHCTDIQGAECVRFWKEYFLCIETLEENQCHVVSPVLQKVTLLWRMVQQLGFHCDWVFVLYKRMFDHDTRTVRLWAINHLVDINTKQLELHSAFIQFVPVHLLSVLKDYHLFLSITSDEIGDFSNGSAAVVLKLSSFLSSLVKHLPREDAATFIKRILNEIFDGSSWEDVSLYHVIKALLAIPRVACINFETAKNVVKESQILWPSQELMLREASQCNLFNFILTHIDDTFTIYQLTQIVCLFGGVPFLIKQKHIWTVLVQRSTEILYANCVVPPLDRNELISDMEDISAENLAMLEHPESLALLLLLKEEAASRIAYYGSDRYVLLSICKYIDGCITKSNICEIRLKHVLELSYHFVDALLNVSHLAVRLNTVPSVLSRYCCHPLKNVFDYLTLLVFKPSTECAVEYVIIINKILQNIINFPFFENGESFNLNIVANNILRSVKLYISLLPVDSKTKRLPDALLYYLQCLCRTVFPLLSHEKQDTVTHLVHTHVLVALPHWLTPPSSVPIGGQGTHGVRAYRQSQEEMIQVVWDCLRFLIKVSWTAYDIV